MIRQYDEPFDNIYQLTDISRPIMLKKYSFSLESISFENLYCSFDFFKNKSVKAKISSLLSRNGGIVMGMTFSL